MTIRELEKEHKRISNIIKLTYKEKTKECKLILEFFYKLCDMADLAEDIYIIDQAEIPYFISSLTHRHYLEMQACIFEGGYFSAARSLRWLYEINLIGSTACIKPILLDQNFSATTGLTLSEFEDLLEKIDSGEIKFGKGKRKNVFNQFKLPTVQLLDLYTDLCKYVHLSKISFDKEYTWPNLQYIPEKFDDIFLLAKNTTDFILLMQSKMCLCYNGGTVGNLKNFLKMSDSIQTYIPLTTSLIKSLK